MIKLKHWAVAVGFLLTVPIFPQGSITKCNSAPQLLPTMPFSLKDYKPQYAGRSDTVWLPKRQETYLWNGEILEMQPKYLLATYNGPNEISTITTMHSFTNDSLFLVYYQYDDHSRSICETYQFYDTTATRWKIDYRALKSYDQFGNISEKFGIRFMDTIGNTITILMNILMNSKIFCGIQKSTSGFRMYALSFC
ncbi:MAG: hypothetical protein B6I19_09500 [Bacteroidetes bacterium 4572_114]|nr:MAG: hypothetical protein B6I19_09500 [Bacteroidetes bacterium 4572_114]